MAPIVSGTYFINEIPASSSGLSNNFSSLCCSVWPAICQPATKSAALCTRFLSPPPSHSSSHVTLIKVVAVRARGKGNFMQCFMLKLASCVDPAPMQSSVTVCPQALSLWSFDTLALVSYGCPSSSFCTSSSSINSLPLKCRTHFCMESARDEIDLNA